MAGRKASGAGSTRADQAAGGTQRAWAVGPGWSLDRGTRVQRVFPGLARRPEVRASPASVVVR